MQHIYPDTGAIHTLVKPWAIESVGQIPNAHCGRLCCFRTQSGQNEAVVDRLFLKPHLFSFDSSQTAHFTLIEP